MRDLVKTHELRIEELSKMKRKDYKSTIWETPEDEVIFLLREIERINKMKQQGVKF